MVAQRVDTPIKRNLPPCHSAAAESPTFATRQESARKRDFGAAFFSCVGGVVSDLLPVHK